MRPLFAHPYCLVIVCFERRSSQTKQCFSPKIKHSAPPGFWAGYATDSNPSPGRDWHATPGSSISSCSSLSILKQRCGVKHAATRKQSCFVEDSHRLPRSRCQIVSMTTPPTVAGCAWSRHSCALPPAAPLHGIVTAQSHPVIDWPL